MIVFWVFSLLAYAQAQTLAFPGAEGFGRFAKGGRGGTVFEVTNLNDAGAGSLRACLEASGPRTCIFRVGGTIILNSPISVLNPFLTIAGHTAPGDGIQIRGEGIGLFTNDVIIRYLRVRPGNGSINPGNNDGIELVGSSNVIVDHSSVSWGTDENTSIWADSTNITFQWNIISEALECADHPECPHSKGMLTGATGTTNVTIHHNLFAHNSNRNPLVERGNFDVVNNVLYNMKFNGIMVTPVATTLINVVGNRYIDGPNSNSNGIRADGRLGGASTSIMYLGELNESGNIVPNPRATDDLPLVNAVEVVWWTQNGGSYSSTRFDYPQVTTTNAFQATTDVLAGAGATIPVRDPVDTRVVNDVTAGTGSIIDFPSQVGGWPNLVNGTPAADTDHDGMPDAWETSHGLDSNDPRDGPLFASNGYTNLENYLNELARDPIPGGTAPSSPTNLRVLTE